MPGFLGGGVGFPAEVEQRNDIKIIGTGSNSV